MIRYVRKVTWQGGSGWASPRRAGPRLWLVVAFYVGLSALLLGRQALGDPSHVCACIGGGDPPAYMWALRWWPYSMTHGLNPLYTHVAWSPSGASVAASALIPFPSLVAWPLSATIGLLPTYNVITLLSPALAASAMYLLCRYLTGRWLASLVGGWLFGFSSYELSQLVGHANLMMIALLPLFPLAVLLRLDRRVRRGTFIAAMVALFAAQLLTSSELLGTGCLIGAFALLLAWLTLPARRGALVELAVETVAAGVLAAVITSPYLYEAVVRGHPSTPPGAAAANVTDLAGLVVPTGVSLIRYAQGVAAKLPGNVAEQGAYLGIPLLLIFGAAIWQLRRDARGWLLAGVGALALLWSLGSTLHIAGHASIPLPWRVVAHLPIARAITPDRVIVYAWLAVSVAVALWLASPGRWGTARWALVAVGLVLILPDGSSPLFGGRPYEPPLFYTSAYKRTLEKDSVVLLLPYGGDGYSMLWQAQSKFWFRMPEGYLSGVPPTAFLADPLAQKFLHSQTTPVAPADIRAFVQKYRVTTIIVDPTDPESWPAQLSAAGYKSRSSGGVTLYDTGT